MTLDWAVQRVQACYLWVPLAGHTRHRRRRFPELRPSAGIAFLLALLAEHSPFTPARLASSPGVAHSSVVQNRMAGAP